MPSSSQPGNWQCWQQAKPAKKQDSQLLRECCCWETVGKALSISPIWQQAKLRQEEAPFPLSTRKAPANTWRCFVNFLHPTLSDPKHRVGRIREKEPRERDSLHLCMKSWDHYQVALTQNWPETIKQKHQELNYSVEYCSEFRAASGQCTRGANQNIAHKL